MSKGLKQFCVCLSIAYLIITIMVNMNVCINTETYKEKEWVQFVDKYVVTVIHVTKVGNVLIPLDNWQFTKENNNWK